MTFKNFSHKKARRPERFLPARCFTLIELLVVVALMGVIFAVGLPAFERLTIGSGVDAAVRQVNAQLRLARQYAISHRCKVALVFPEDQSGMNDNNKFACFRPALVTSSTTTWVPNTHWTFLPTGVVAFTNSSSLSSVSMKLDTVSTSTASAVTVKAIVFKSTGALDTTSSQSLLLGEGFYAGSAGLKERGTGNKNKLTIVVNPFTGRTVIQ